MDNGEERCLARRIGIEYGGGRGLWRKLEYIGEGCIGDKYREFSSQGRFGRWRSE